MCISRISVEKITDFDKIDISLSKGINVFIGENGSGKTHLMKLLYASMKYADATANITMDQLLQSLFLPDSLGRIVRRSQGRSKGQFSVYRQDEVGQSDVSFRYELNSLGRSQTVNVAKWRKDKRFPVVFIPVKDMLANSAGFKSLYDNREISFESIYADIVSLALLPPTKGHPSGAKSKLLELIQSIISGKVEKKEEKFYLKNEQGSLEFTLLAEGFRKLGLLYTLIQNESLSTGSILFWDEPEANLNPRLTKQVVQIIIELQRMGTQVFIATHDYMFLKEMELATEESKDAVSYHSLYKEEGNVKCMTVERLADLEHNVINDAFDSLLVRSINKGFEQVER